MSTRAFKLARVGKLAAVSLLLVVTVAAATSVSPAQSDPVWEPAEEIASVSTQTFGQATGMSCVTDDDCVMVGYLGWSPSIAVAAEKVGGEWGELKENPGLSQSDLPDWDPAASVTLRPVSCLGSGECVAGGQLGLTTGGSTGYVTTRTAGTWSAETIPGLIELSTDTGATPNAEVMDLSCDATGTCLAGGGYRYGAANNLFGGWVATRTNGTWSSAVSVPGLEALNTRDNGKVNSVACPGGGNCVATGMYSTTVGANNRGQAFIAEYANGTWTDAFPVPGLVPPEGVNQGSASFEGVACADFDNCAATGRYWNGSAFQGFVVNKVAGTWNPLVDIPGLAPANNVQAQHVTCPAVGACALMAANFTTNTGYLASQSGGVWQDAVPLTFAGAGSSFNAARGISCSAPGECIAVGNYRPADSSFQAWQAVQSGGVWAEANSVPGMADLLTKPPSRSHGEAVSCVSGAGCNVGGVTFFDAIGQPAVPYRLFAAARVSPPPPPTTTTTTTPEPTTTVPGPTTTAPAPTTTAPAPNGDLQLNLSFRVGSNIRNGGSEVTASAQGLAPRADLLLVLRSEPQVIGASVTNDDGDGEVTGTIPSDTGPGRHTLTAESVNRNGDVVTATVWFALDDSGNVTAVSHNGPTPDATRSAEESGSGGSGLGGLLPATGFGLAGVAVAAGGLVAGGVALAGGSRLRRRRSAPTSNA
jgi:hypothetical protein